MLLLSGHVPWDPGKYDRHLSRIVRRFGVEPCRVLNPGCGNGKSAVWPARQGFEVIGIDLSPAAIFQARGRVRSHHVEERTNFFGDASPMNSPLRTEAVRWNAGALDSSLNVPFCSMLAEVKHSRVLWTFLQNRFHRTGSSTV